MSTRALLSAACHFLLNFVFINFVDMCGWHDESTGKYDWERHQGSTPSKLTGPNTDHTKQTPSGWYVFVDASQGSGETSF